MNDSFTRQLHNDFPALYRGIGKSCQESALHWGFECGDGWYPLIHQLSERLAEHQRQRQRQQPALDLQITQVKSKFGTLRIHSRGGDAHTDQLIAEACAQATSIDECA